MKIKHLLMLSGSLTITLLVLILAFASHDMSQVVAKLRFVEVVDDLDVSLLEMRLAEKNYFLFDDRSALNEISSGATHAEKTLVELQPDILQATGPGNVRTLRGYLTEYARIASEIAASGARDTEHEDALREAGRRVRDFSTLLVHAERKNVNRIIADSRKGLFLTFAIILGLVVLAGPIVYVRLLRSLRRVVDLSHSIAEGRFRHIEGQFPNDELGTVLTAMNAMSDELRSRENELVQSKKLASLGTLTAGVAHEITNPLNNISMLAETYDTMYDDLGREERVEFVRKIAEESERIRKIVVGLLNFSRSKQPSQQRIQPNEIVRGAMHLVGNMLEVSSVEAELHLAENLPDVFIDVNQLYQVLVNITTNAIQAMAQTRKQERKFTVTTRLGATPDTVAIALHDSGKGIPAEVLPHIFDPFYSTKGVNGTGLGLSVSYGIITNHGGKLLAENAPDGGAVLTVELPACHAEKETDHGRTENHGD